MKLLVFVWTLSSVIIVVCIGIAVIAFLFEVVKDWFNRLFKKNCRRCKHCKLHSVPSCGDGSTWRCDLTGETKFIKSGTWYKKCKQYEE